MCVVGRKCVEPDRMYLRHAVCSLDMGFFGEIEASRPCEPSFRSLVKLILDSWILHVRFPQYKQIIKLLRTGSMGSHTGGTSFFPDFEVRRQRGKR